LNPDTKILKKALEKNLRFLRKNKEVGMTGVRLIAENGSPQLTAGRKQPSIWGEICSFFNLFNSSLGKNKFFGSYLMSYWDHKDRRPVEAISGAYMMIRSKLLKQLKGFDESFFMYGEDLDLCFRVKKLGFKIYFLGEIEVTHFGAISSSYSKASTIRSGIAEVHALYNYFKKNKSLFYARSYQFIIRTLSFLDLIRRTVFSIVPTYRKNEVKMTRIQIDKKIVNWDSI
jgi:GT2 family glycosyltransferase